MRHKIIKRVLGDIKKYGLISRGQNVYLSFSGGMDSVVLFHVLRTVSNSISFNLCLLHINHRLREESCDEERWAINFSISKGVPLILKRLEKHGNRKNQSIEEWAHSERYRLYTDMLKLPDSVIVTAHHLNDKIETLLLSLFKGNIGSPFGSIRIKSGSVVRPLLYVKKSEINDFAKKYKLCFLTDSSNFNLAYERNYVRHRIMPLIDERFPGIYNQVEHFENRFSLQKDYIDSVVGDFLNENLEISKNTYTMNIKGFYNLHKALQAEIIRKLLLRVYKCNKTVSYNLISEIMGHLTLRKGSVKMPGNYLLSANDKTLIIKD